MTVQPDRKDELTDHLALHWKRAYDGRAHEVEFLYKLRDKAYRAVPNQKTRNFPWPNASNIVVPIIRMYTDTFVARTLNAVFNTRPLVTIQGYPAALRDALEAYVNLKCRQDWEVYELARGILNRGNKYGTSLTKVFWREEMVNVPQFMDDKVEALPAVKYSGPWADHIAFDDWFVYPLTANSVAQVEIFFHRLRYPEEVAYRMARPDENGEKKLDLTEEQVKAALKQPDDVKREQEQRETGVGDSDYREMHLIECHHRWKVGGSEYHCISTFEPVSKQVVDFKVSQYPPQIDLFHAYRPFPRDDVFQGESMYEILGQGQEEVSTIHNDRRNLSVMASAPLVLMKEGVRVPNASTPFYPGKVYRLEDMDDFRVEKIGGNYQEMMAEENQALALMDRVSGISAGMQAASQGGLGKGGVYNAQGTMAVMSEGNQRQDTNMKDFRESLGGIIKAMFALQARFDPQDPAIEQLPEEMRPLVMEAMRMTTPEQLARSIFEVNISDAAMNREVRKSSMMTMANALSQFAGQQQQLATVVANQQTHPALRQIASETITMQHGMMKAMLSAFDLHGIVDTLPNAQRALASGPNGSPQGAAPGPGGAGGPGAAPPPQGMAGPPAPAGPPR